VVLDITIVSDSFDLEDACCRKIQYYQKEEIINWVKCRTREDTVTFGAVVASWRGCVAESTYKLLTYQFGIGNYFFSLMGALVSVYGYYTWRYFKDTTYRSPS